MSIFDHQENREFLFTNYGLIPQSTLEDWQRVWKINYSEVIVPGTLDEFMKEMTAIIGFQKNTMEYVQYLITKGYEKALGMQQNLLHTVMATGRFDLVPLLLKVGNRWDEQAITTEKTPLLFLFYQGNPNLQKKCLECFFDFYNNDLQELMRILSLKDKEGKTFLHYCAITKNITLANMVKEKIGDENYFLLLKIKDKDGAVPVYSALLNSRKVDCIAPFFHSQFVNFKNQLGRNLYFVSIIQNKLDLAQFFSQRGVPSNTQDMQGNTVWHLVLKNGNEETINFLKINHMDQLRVPNKQGFLPQIPKPATEDNSSSQKFSC